MLGEKFNFEDVFFRDLTVCVLDTLEGQVKWVNRFSSGDLAVEVPFYYSLTGDERFLLDSFSDDIVSENRFIELNTDNIPRGHLTMTGFNIKSDEFANPNVWLRMVVENDQEIRKVLAKVRAIPISVNYDLTITLASELDTFKCAQAIMDTMWIYKFMYFEHNFMNIDAVILMPDTNQIEMAREKNLTSDNNIQLKVSFEVSTYYPAFRKDRVSATGKPTYEGTGMSDLNGFTINGGVSDLFGSIDPNFGSVGGTEYTGPGVNNNNHYTGTGSTVSNHYTGDPISGYPGGLPYPFANPLVFPPPDGIGGGNGVFGMTNSFYDTASTGNPFGTGAAQVISNGRLTNDPDYYQIAPKRTRWFNNILRSRERSSGGSNPRPPNPNA
jgi:hypothetical protein